MADPAEAASDSTPVADDAPDVRIRMLHDRLLVQPDRDTGERKSSAGIVIPATAAVGRRLAWGVVAAAGPLVRQVEIGDSILFDPDELAEVEIDATAYVLLRERDVHAIAEPDDDESTGMYL